jgi:hypothetical protein
MNENNAMNSPTNDRLNFPRTAFAAALLAGGFVSAAALAQEEPPARELRGDLRRPLAVVERGEPKSRVTTVISETDEHGTYTVRVEGDQTTVERDGKAIPAERVRRSADKVEVLDESGNVTKSFRLNVVAGSRVPVPPGAAGAIAGRQPQADGWRELARGGGGWSRSPGVALVEPPSVMIGITMADPEPQLLEHLGLDVESGILIETVVEGLPAEKAGVKRSDLIIEIDGQKPATQQKLRETLRGKKAGDTLELKLVRKGDAPKVVKLELVAFEEGRLGTAPTTAEGFSFDFAPFVKGTPEAMGDAGGVWTEELRRHLEDALSQIKDEAAKVDTKQLREIAVKALEEALAQIETHRQALTIEMNELFQNLDDASGPQIMRFFGPGSGRVFVAPAPEAPAAPQPPEATLPRAPRTTRPAPAPAAASGGADLERLFDRLNERLDRLDERLDNMEKRGSAPRR